mgnify:CR=1 FL=1
MFQPRNCEELEVSITKFLLFSFYFGLMKFWNEVTERKQEFSGGKRSLKLERFAFSGGIKPEIEAAKLRLFLL